MSTPCWLSGLPFDCVSLEQARAQIFDAIDRQRQLVFATPNVSFLAQAGRDDRFREDVLLTNLSLPDGMPIIWLGALMGIPFAGRVAGSDLLESLVSEPGPRTVRVFFFGGNPGAGEAAMHAVNRRGGGIQAVGAIDPGFVSVAGMSDQATIDAINLANADFLVVALGSAKGHRWIEANRHRLNVPVISHLGAAINFIAGRLQRAPRFMQRTGLEWLWRIKEEPALFRRYARDGWFLAQQFAGFILPELLARALRGSPPSSLVARSDAGVLTVQASRLFGAREIKALQGSEWQRQLQAATALRMQLVGVTQLDAVGVGWLYAVRYRLAAGIPATVHCDRVSQNSLKRWRADFLAAPSGGQTRHL
ncbi:MAG: WecB/TagA/CpsF family glycosyltransferase [Pseudomonadota bacterium]